jgi:F-type H+-transporting ATPase subunit gamma
MSKLIQLRQRIKVIDTIQKITHAMRLISMSIHTHLKRKEGAVIEYVQNLDSLFAQLQLHAPQWTNSIIYPQKNGEQKTLVILIGSQKGLCGSFNLNLFKLCDHCMKDVPAFQGRDEFIGVGKKAADFLKNTNLKPILKTFDKFSPQRLFPISQEIAHLIMNATPAYDNVIILSNEFKTFFNQKPTAYTLIPFDQQSPSAPDAHNDIVWEQTPESLLNDLVHQHLEAKIYFKLFESLLAEHAARFISMDTATQNADGLLDAAKLQYNKLRQAKITKELTELSSSYE